MKARLKRAIISPQSFFQILGTDSSWQVVEGIPEGARFVGFAIDPETQNIAMFVEHKSFPEIEVEKEVAPIMKMLFRAI